MKQIYKTTAISLALGAFITGCDVTSNSGGTSTQASDPVVSDFPIAYIQRPVPVGLEDEDDTQVGLLSEDFTDPTEFRPGAQLVLKARANVAAEERILTDGIFPTPTPDPADPDAEQPTPLYDVRDLSVNEDGSKLVFSMRAPEIEGAQEEDQPKWDIYEYDLANDVLTRVIEQDSIAQEGHDRYPVYLPDDSIVFSSTRQRRSKALLLDASRAQYAYVTERDDDARAFTLHRINEDRTTIQQISYGKGHDIQPTLLSDGKILFVRGDSTSTANGDRYSLYTMNSDGSNVTLHYGYHSPSSTDTDGQGAISKPLQMPATADNSVGRIMVSYRQRDTNLLGGDIVAINAADFIDLDTPTSSNPSLPGPAEESLSFGEVVVNAQSPHGYFNSAYPLFDDTGRFLVSWMPCLVQGYRVGIYVRIIPGTEGLDPDATEIPPDRYVLINIDGESVDRSGNVIPDGNPDVEITLDEIVSLPCTDDSFDNPLITASEPQYGVWIYDPNTQTQDPVVLANDVGTIYTEAVVFQDKLLNIQLPERDSGNFSTEEIERFMLDNVGVINIRSIYDVDGQDTTAGGISAMADPLQTPPDTRPIRFVRFYEHANMPHEDDYEIDNTLVGGRNGNPSRSIIGYAQVHPDGSVMAKVPADTAFAMEFLDANGRRVTGAFNVRHNNWLNVRPGEVKTCNGCHTAASTAPHGRPDAEPEPANLGALASAQFPNTRLENFLDIPFGDPDIGETMAEYYVRSIMADNDDTRDPLSLSVDIEWTDDWTDPSSGATPGADISFVYGVSGQQGPDNLLTTPPVLIGECLNEWNYLCRIVIDYPDHIQPIFEAPRSALVNGVDTDVTCTNCHTATDEFGADRIPDPDINGLQLDFRNVDSDRDANMDFLMGYDDLFVNNLVVHDLNDAGALVQRTEIRIVNGQIVYEMVDLIINGIQQVEAIDQNGLTQCIDETSTDPNFTFVLDAQGAMIRCQTPRTEQQTDVDGNALFEADDVLNGLVCVPDSIMDPNITLRTDPVDGSLIPCLQQVPERDNVTRNRYLNPNGANATQNDRFFDAFGPGGAHADYLTPAELKLFSEWLDMGGQYYNEIFKALDD